MAGVVREDSPSILRRVWVSEVVSEARDEMHWNLIEVMGAVNLVRVDPGTEVREQARTEVQ